MHACENVWCLYSSLLLCVAVCREGVAKDQRSHVTRTLGSCPGALLVAKLTSAQNSLSGCRHSLRGVRSISLHSFADRKCLKERGVNCIDRTWLRPKESAKHPHAVTKVVDVSNVLSINLNA